MRHFGSEFNYLKKAGVGALYRGWKTGRGVAPFQANFMITGKCNLRCIMCSIWQTPPEAHRDELSTDEVKAAIEQLAALGTGGIGLTGGEPTVREDILEIVGAAKNKNMRVTLVTNGTAITETLARGLVKARLDTITFSIDSPDPEIHDRMRGRKGTWEKAVEGLTRIDSVKRERGRPKPRIVIDYLITNVNYNLIGRMLDLQPQLNYDVIRFVPHTGIEGLSLSNEEKTKLRNSLPLIKTKLRAYGLSFQYLPGLMLLSEPKERIRKRMCFIPWLYPVINPWGDVFPCCHAASAPPSSRSEQGLIARGQERFIMGNIRSQKFTDIWNDRIFIAFREQCKERVDFYRCGCCNYAPFNLFLSELFTNRPFLFTFIWRKILNPRYTYQDMLVDSLGECPA